VESAREAYKNGYDGYNSGYWQSPVPQRKIEHLQVFLVSDVDIGETARELAYCLDCDGSETFVGISYATSASEDLVNSAKELDAEFVCGRIID